MATQQWERGNSGRQPIEDQTVDGIDSVDEG